MPAPTSSPELKKAPQFAAVKLRPIEEKTTSCCAGGHCEARETPEITAEGERYSWQVDGMDCAACARKVENAVRQIEGVGQVQVAFATEKLIVVAQDDVRERVERAVQQAGYQLRSENAPAPETSRLRENLPLLLLIVMMALSWGLEQVNHPFGQMAFIATTLVGLWPIARQALRLMKSGSWFAIET